MAAAGCPGRPVGLPLREAVALGLAHGPAELLPVSSSGHLTLIGWLAGWSYPELDPGFRKDFEVALHAGTAAAQLVVERRELVARIVELDRRRLAVLVLAIAPPALAGYAFEDVIERRAGGPAAIALGLIAGSVAMALAESRGGRSRGGTDARAVDGLLLGLAQTCALIPGVSRSGATRAIARARGFRREDAATLSRECGMPIIAGAVSLRLLRRSRLGPGARPASGRLRPPRAQLGAGALAAFLSALATQRLVGRRGRGGSLLPFAAYRTALGLVVIARTRRQR